MAVQRNIMHHAKCHIQCHIISSKEIYGLRRGTTELLRPPISSEGTLGVMTRAALKLSSLLGSQNTVLAANDSFEKVTELLNSVDRELGG